MLLRDSRKTQILNSQVNFATSMPKFKTPVYSPLYLQGRSFTQKLLTVVCGELGKVCGERPGCIGWPYSTRTPAGLLVLEEKSFKTTA
jgi:hypothetical protein